MAYTALYRKFRPVNFSEMEKRRYFSRLTLELNTRLEKVEEVRIALKEAEPDSSFKKIIFRGFICLIKNFFMKQSNHLI